MGVHYLISLKPSGSFSDDKLYFSSAHEETVKQKRNEKNIVVKFPIIILPPRSLVSLRLSPDLIQSCL